jgi:hypothetical protein
MNVFKVEIGLFIAYDDEWERIVHKRVVEICLRRRRRRGEVQHRMQRKMLFRVK